MYLMYVCMYVEENSLSGVSSSISPEQQPLLFGMSPQLVMAYDNDAHILHRDIYRIFCHAAETTNNQNSDKVKLFGGITHTNNHTIVYI